MSEKDKNKMENENMTPREGLENIGTEESADVKTPEREEEAVIDVEKTIEALSNALTDATKKAEDAQKLAEETKEAHIRTLAEYDNFRKRTAKEKTDSYNNGLSTAVTGILPVIDTLEMALSAPTSDENFKKGIEMTLMTAHSALKNLGVEEIEALDMPFDPTVHNAVMQEEVRDTEPGIVTKLLQKGYRMGDKIIRPATVVVSC